MDDQQNGLMVSKPTPTRPDHAVSFYSNTGDSRFKQYEASSPISSFFNDQDTDVHMNSKTFSELLSGNGDGFMFGGEEKPLAMSSSSRGNGGFGSGGSFAERLAARGAASYSTAEIPRLSTARFKSMPPSSLPIPRSPYLSIPPGLSPTTLLDSPVLLSTSLALPSPTTGTFPLPPVSYESGAATSLDVLKDEDENCSGFAFKPASISSSSSDLQPLGNLVSFGYSHPQASKGAEAESKAWGVPASSKTKEFVVDATPEPPVSGGTPLNSVLPGIASAQAASSEEQQQRQSSNFQAELSETNHNALFPPTVIERPSEDGYNWRKYGQKHVKGSEYPRSYYKCTHLNCPTKKKVERSLDGHVTEIVYKGAHNHPKPLPNRRMGVGAARATHEAGERAEGVGAVIKVEGGSSWGNTQLLKVNDATNYSQEWKNEGLDRSSSASVVTELSDPSSTPPRQNSCRLESSGTPEHSSVSASDDDDGRAPADKLLGDDVDEDESVSKRRKKENNTVDIIGATRTIREPRVVVQTTSDIDILDDGYRWRKYGQKVVKGNPNPRSYYKCTNAGCPVRKHVERASHDPKAVITTYEGKHNHDVPAARNSSHNSAGTGNGPSATVLQNNATSSTTAIALAGSQLQDTVSHFDGHPDLGNNYAKHNYMFGRAANSNLNSQDRNVGIADQGTGAGMGLGVFGLNNGHCERQQTEVPSSFSMHINPANHGFAGNGFNDSIQSFFGQTKERDGGLIRPKEEQKDNFCFETSFH